MRRRVLKLLLILKPIKQIIVDISHITMLKTLSYKKFYSIECNFKETLKN